MNEITTVGVDLAKEVIAVCAADRSGRIVYTRVFGRDAFAQWAVQLPPCSFGLEACGAAHHWARWLASHGHTARMMAAEFVQPFRKSRAAKNDRNDAEAVLTAVRQPNMRFVAVKSVEQQARLAWHRMRQGWIEERTALINRLRGLLGEFGVWRGRSATLLTRALPALENDEALPLLVRRLLGEARQQLTRLDAVISACEAEINSHVKANPRGPTPHRDQRRGRPHRRGGARHRHRCPRLQEWTPVCRLAGSGAAAGELRRQNATGPHHQARRQLPARLAHARSALGIAGRTQSAARDADSAATLDRATVPSRRLPQDLGGHRQQTRADDLGDPRQGRSLRSRRLAATQPVCTSDEHHDSVTQRTADEQTERTMISRDDRGEIDNEVGPSAA
jgi:Transposase